METNRLVKGKISPVLYAIGIGLSFLWPWAPGCIYVLVALMWLVPDRRMAQVAVKEPAGVA